MSLSTGSRLGSDEVVALLGEGGMGAVYRARDTKLTIALQTVPILRTFAGDLKQSPQWPALLNAVNLPGIDA